MFLRSRSRHLATALTTAVAAVAVVAGTVLTAAAAVPRGYSQSQAPTINGTMITGMYSSSSDKPFYAAGYQLGPENAGNVAGITCPGTATGNLTGGPGGSPECLFATPVTSAVVSIIGRNAWPSTVTLTPFYSFDNQTYVMAPAVTATTPAPLMELTTPTVLQCTGTPLRIVLAIGGQPTLAPAAAGDPVAPRVAVYAGEGTGYPDAQFAADLDTTGHARASGLCSPSSEKPPRSSRLRRRAARTAVELLCDSTKTAGVVVDPQSDRVQVVKDGKVVFDVSISGKPAVGYDKKVCQVTTVAK